MINSLVDKMIKDSVKAEKLYRAKMERVLITKHIDYYSGDNTLQYIKPRFKGASFQEVPPVNFNLTKKFISKISRVYSLGADRSAGNQYDKMAIKKDYSFKHIERMTKLLGTIAVRVGIAEDVSGNPHFEYLPVYYFDAHFGDNPFKPISLTYPIISTTSDVDNVNKLKYAFWDSENYIEYDEDGNILKEVAHNYGFLPFVFTHKEHQIVDFKCSGADDVVNCNESVNLLLTEANLGMRFQMFGQPIITGLYSDEKVTRAGTDEAMILPEGANFSFQSPSSNIGDAIELVKSMINLCATNNNLQVQFSNEGKERASSGIALKIKDLDMHTNWLNDLGIWESYEMDFYNIEKQLADLDGIKLPDTMGLNFNEPDYPKNVQDQIAWDKHLLENNLTTQPKLLANYNNDLSENEATSLVDDYRKVNDANKPESTQSVFNRLRRKTATT